MKIRSRMFICILGLLAMSLWSVSAFAQASVTISSTPETTAISTGHTEVAGSVLFQAVAPGAGLGAGSSVLTVDYRVPITVPAAGYIVVCGTGSLSPVPAITVGGCTTAYTPAITGVAGTFQIGGTNQNQLLISLPATAAGGSGSLEIRGVKVSLSGYAPTSLTATLGVSAPSAGGAYSIIAGQNFTDVISSIQPAFTTAVMTGTTGVALSGAGATTNQGSGQILTTTTVNDRLFNIDIPETFVDAFQATLGTSGYLNDPALTVTFNNIPNGVFLNLLGGGTGTTNALCTAAAGTVATDQPVFYNASSGVTTLIPSGSLTNPVISNGANSTILTFTGLGFNATQLEDIRIRGCIYTSGATAPLVPATITAAITLSPNGAALSSGTQIPPVAGNFPRYQSSLITVNAITIVAPETDMLISFAARNTSGFDTGIAIANTSTDPFGTTNGVTPNDGVITLNFYPQGSGSAFTYTTAAGAPGLGLNATGVLVSGKTWSVGLSELLGAITGAPTSFTGYIFVRAAFTNAHGAAYVTDYRGFTSASPFLIVPLGRVTTNENLNQ